MPWDPSPCPCPSPGICDATAPLFRHSPTVFYHRSLSRAVSGQFTERLLGNLCCLLRASHAAHAACHHLIICTTLNNLFGGGGTALPIVPGPKGRLLAHVVPPHLDHAQVCATSTAEHASPERVRLHNRTRGAVAGLVDLVPRTCPTARVPTNIPQSRNASRTVLRDLWRWGNRRWMGAQMVCCRVNGLPLPSAEGRGPGARPEVQPRHRADATDVKGIGTKTLSRGRRRVSKLSGGFRCRERRFVKAFQDVAPPFYSRMLA